MEKSIVKVNILRIAERGLKLSERTDAIVRSNTPKSIHITTRQSDLWRQVLGEIERL